jgi:hypothetical protein
MVKRKIFITFIFYSRLDVKQEFYGTFVEFWKHRFVMQKLQNPLLCSHAKIFHGAGNTVMPS